MTNLRALIKKSHRSFKFAIVGGIGFLVDATVLIIIFEFMQLDLIYARVIAFSFAASSNWILNRAFTFSDINLVGKKSAEWIRFFISAIVSAIPNLGIFFLLMLILPESLVFVIFAMCCGILAGYYSNYRLARVWVFRSQTL
ncbi:MAG: GtrA family protein [Gammaproteobacteria bacterium]